MTGAQIINVFVTTVGKRYAVAVAPDATTYYRVLYHEGFTSEFLRVGDRIAGRPVPARDGGTPLLLNTVRVKRPPDRWPERVTAQVEQCVNSHCYAQDAVGGNYYVPVTAPIGSVISGRVEAPANGARLPRLIPQ